MADVCGALVRVAARVAGLALVGNPGRVPAPPGARCGGQRPPPVDLVGDPGRVPAPPGARSGGQSPPPLDLSGPFERTTVREVLERHAGLALGGRESIAELAAKARAAGAAARGRAARAGGFFSAW